MNITVGNYTLIFAVQCVAQFRLLLATVCNTPFGSSITYVTGNGPVSATFGYFRNSIDLDLIVADKEDNSVILMLGDGKGAFTYPGIYTVGNVPFSVISADFNNDSKLDLAVCQLCRQHYQCLAWQWECNLSDSNDLYGWYPTNFCDIRRFQQ